MSQENVEVLKAGYAAWNAGDMDALRDLYDPDAMIVRGLEGWPESGPQIGRDAIIRYFEQLRETWDTDTLELVSDFTEVGDRVLVRQHWRGTGQGPGLDIEFTSVTTLRNGKIFLVEWFWDHTEALASLGLSEQDAHADS